MRKSKAAKKPYSTVGIRFLDGHNLHKIYTYRTRKGAKVHLGMELVVPTPRGHAIGVAVRLDKTPQDTENFIYKFVAGKIGKL